MCFWSLRQLKRLILFTLPPRCGIVSANEFSLYFGAFGSRAYRRFLEPSKYQHCFIPWITLGRRCGWRNCHENYRWEIKMPILESWRCSRIMKMHWIDCFQTRDASPPRF
jgi:hypothetical protein